MPLEINTTPYNSIPDKWAFDEEVGPFIRELLDLIFQLRSNQLSNLDYHQEVTEGVTKYEVIHKFGTNEAVGTTFEPVARSGWYRTPITGAALPLRIKAGGDAADDADIGGGTPGAGALEITLEGLNASGEAVTETLATNGASASSNTTNSFLRLYRAYVSASGTYATASAGSHSAAITIEDSVGVQSWALIDATGFPKGQTEIACYTVPAGKTATIRLMDIEVEGTKSADILLFQRQGITETAAPFSPMRTVLDFIGVEESHEIVFKAPLGPFPAGTDIGFMAKTASGTTAVSVDFEIWLY